jgi:hypothetical protein
MLSYTEHGRSRAIAQERTSSRFSPPAKRGTEEALSLNGVGLLRLFVFRNVLRLQWTTGGADAQGASLRAQFCLAQLRPLTRCR